MRNTDASIERPDRSAALFSIRRRSCCGTAERSSLKGTRKADRCQRLDRRSCSRRTEPPMLSDLRFRLRAVFNRRAMERDLDNEVRFHLEQETKKLVARGISPGEAARQAVLSFGGVNRIKDDARDARGVALWDSLRQDVGYAWRGLWARPGFTA